MVRFTALFVMILMALYFGAGEWKNETRTAKLELRATSLAILEEREKIRVLKAEWSHRTEPEILRRLAEEHLGLATVRVEQIASIEDVPYLGMDLFDDHPEAMPVEFTELPRTKPDVLMAQQARPLEDGERHAATAVEYVIAGPGGFGRK